MIGAIWLLGVGTLGFGTLTMDFPPPPGQAACPQHSRAVPRGQWLVQGSMTEDGREYILESPPSQTQTSLLTHQPLQTWPVACVGKLVGSLPWKTGGGTVVLFVYDRVVWLPARRRFLLREPKE